MLILLSPDGQVSISPSIALADGSQYATQGYAYPKPPGALPLQLPEWGCLTQVFAHGHCAEVLTDHIGAYPLYEARSPSGLIILGGDAWEVARRAGLMQLNVPACFDLLAFEYVTGTDTLVEQLREVAPATRMQFAYENGAWRCREKRVWMLERPDATLAVEVSVDAAYENLMAICRPMAGLLGENAAGKADFPINLSGGWDSRAVLAGAIRAGAPPTVACSYGNPEYLGISTARQLAAAVSMPHKLFPFSNSSFLQENFSSLIDMMPPVARFNLADGALALGENFYGNSRAVLCGHNGDAFTKVPSSLVGKPLASPAELADAVAKVLWGTWSPRALNRVLRSAAKDVIPGISERLQHTAADVFSPGLTGYFRWKTNSVRRAASVELRMLERFTPVVIAPLVDRQFIEFWSTVSERQLIDQRLYRRMLFQRMFTDDLRELGQIPRESGTGLSPDGLAARSHEFVSDNYLRILRRVAPAAVARKTAADPTALWWHTEPGLRKWAWELLENSAFVNEHFDLGKLHAQVSDGGRLDPSFARIGVWNLLTIPGVEQALNRGASG